VATQIKKSTERAIAGTPAFPAGFLCRPDKQCMEFVEEFRVVRKIVHEKLLEFTIADIIFETEMPRHNSFCVCVNHKSRQIETVEQDAVGRLRSDALDIQDGFPPE
jgi:hypothetical protein